MRRPLCGHLDTASGGKLMVIGSGGAGSAVALSSAANELATSFTTISSLGVSAGASLSASGGASLSVSGGAGLSGSLSAEASA